ncbi:hypothetical protein T459_28224 [Capsicum annuum]|uniref:Uncharacterized protein n=1 Tax=Capsicum annuum TaxID=4072 RepID=A0A2G2YG86_CAPAN|nr:hypothetical protein T459_28224 [Capsicum annuum]
MDSGDLDCELSNVMISYLTKSRKKVHPMIISNDRCMSLYMLDIGVDVFRSIIRINVVERPFEEPLNLSPPPPWLVDDSADYENKSDHPINIKDDSMDMEYNILDSHAHHGLCMRHLCENLRVNQYYEDYLALFYYAAKAYYLNEFSEIFTKFKDKCPKVAHIFENVVGFEKWSRAYFSGNRYNVMTTNIAKSVNSLLMKKRKYPVSYIFNSISKKFDEKFKERHAHVGNSNKKLGPYVKKILRDNKRENDFLYVTNANGDLD